MSVRISKYLLVLIAVLAGLLCFNYEPQLFPPKQKIKMSGAMQAMQFWNESRAYPNNKLPAIGLSKEFFKEKLTLKKSPDGKKWQQLGPHNIGGRTISLAFNPQNSNTIYAGSASGGLWRSYTKAKGKNAWHYVPTGYPLLGVSSITFAPGDSNEIYIGTGEVYNYDNTLGGVTIRETRGSYGIGILKSTDGGSNWFKSLDWSYNQGHGVWVIRINPLNRKTVWAGTTEGTYKSTDAGKSWQLVNNTIMVSDLIINPVDTSTVLIACGNLGSKGHGIYRTKDGGGVWTKLQTGIPASYGGKALFSVYDKNPSLIYLSIGNGYTTNAGTWLLRSENGGDTWTVQSTYDYSTYQGWFAHFVVVNQNNPETILTAGVDVFKSNDAGKTLTRKSVWYNWDFGRTPAGGPEGASNYSHADHHTFVIDPTDPNSVYFGNDGGIFRTTDFGETFEGLNGGYQTTQFYNGFATSESDSNFSIGGMQDNSTAIYDGSNEWVRAIGGDGGWAAINQKSNSISYGSYQRCELRKLTRIQKGVYSESPMSPPNGGAVGFIAPYVISPSDPGTLYAGRGIIYKTITGNPNWAATNGGLPISTNPPVSMAISHYNPDVVFACTAPVVKDPEIFRTTDGGDSWKNVAKNLPDRYPMDIALDPNNHKNVYVVYSGFGNSHAFRSTDLGDSWINIGNGLPDVPTNSIIPDPAYPGHIYVGNDLGVYFSPDSGETWTSINEGLPDACMVTNLTISHSNNKLRIATHGNGAYERDLVSKITDVKGIEGKPTDFVLIQNYPNPFNPATTITFKITEPRKVTLIIYDALGREVKTLVNEFMSAGSHKLVWDGTNNSGAKSSTGIYIYNLMSDNFSQSKKMILLR